MDFRLLRHLSYFKAVADERHFGRAAQRLGISQPPLSQQIKTLESNLGFALFDRSRRGVSLTPEAIHILPAVDRLLAEGEKLDLVTIEARQGKTGRLTIGAIAFSMQALLPDLLRRARQLMPEAGFVISEFDSNEALAALEGEEIDIAFLRAEERRGDLNVVPLLRDQLVLAIAKDHPLAAADAIALSDLKREPMIICPREISPSYFDRIVEICRRGDLAPRLTFKARSISSQLAYVACGTAVALVPKSMALETMADMHFLPVVDDTTIVTLAIAWRADNQSPILDRFLKLMPDLGK